MALILTCFKCQTNYFITPSSIPAGGRKVKCANCGHVWNQLPSSTQEQASSEQAPVSPTPSKTDPIPDKSSLPVLFTEKLKQIESLLKKASAAAAVLIFLITPFAFSDKILEIYPASAGFYHQLGLVETGLVYFDTIESESFQTQEKSLVNLKGTINNDGYLPEHPAINIVLLDKNKNPIRTLNQQSLDEPIAAKSSTSFSTTVKEIHQDTAFIAMQVSQE